MSGATAILAVVALLAGINNRCFSVHHREPFGSDDMDEARRVPLTLSWSSGPAAPARVSHDDEGAPAR